MSGICGIAFSERSQQQRFHCLTGMLHELDPSRKTQGRIKIGESSGIGVQEFPGRLTGIAELREREGTSVLGFHGSIYNLPEVLASSEECHDPIAVMLTLSLQGLRDFIASLRGEFVFSLWDARQEMLFLATDRFRIHPLFYTHDQTQLVFSSRMRGLLACPYVHDLAINPSAIIDVISSSFIPTPRTIFQKVQKLGAGQLLSWSQGECQVESYWDVTFNNSGRFSRSHLSEELRETFSNSLMVRLNYDKTPNQIGSFLSGVLTQLAQTPMKSFSIGFGEETFDEMDYARCAVDAFGAQSHEYIVTADDTFQIIDLLIEAFDEPYANASAIPTYYCAKLAKEHGIQMLYGGDGGDELFAGNERYATQKIFDYYGKFPPWLRDGGIQPAVFALANLLKIRLFTKGKKYIQRANTPYPDRLFSWGLFELLPIEDVFSKDFLQSVGGSQYDPHHRVRELYEQSKGFADTELDRQLYLDLKLVISDNDVLKVTRMTEANGIAVRFPFLDQRLAEFAASIPANVKMQGTKLRTFFKDSYADLLPPKIRMKTKHGFGLPIPMWLRTDKKLRDLMLDVLQSEAIRQRGYFNKNTIDELIKRHREDTTSFYGTMLWNFVMLELWLRRYCDKM
ncbi:MAG: asparagine synthetase B family protein [Nitrospirales bacterium]